MRLWLRLMPRIAVAALMNGFIAGTLAMVIALVHYVDLTARQVAEIGRVLHRGPVGDDCRSNAQRWTLTTPEGVRLYPYDRSTGRANNPDSPLLDPELFARVTRGEIAPYRLYRGLGGDGGAVALALAESGPCSLFLLVWKRDARRWWAGFRDLALPIFFAAMLSAIFGTVLIARPLVARIDRLRAKSELIGGVGEWPETHGPVLDELDEVDHALSGAHARIRADASLLEERGRALERHLEDVAHDLKTPLASLGLVLEEAIGTRDAELHATLVSQAIEDVVYLSALTEDLRLACRLQSGLQLNVGGVQSDLREIAESIVTRLRLIARRRDIDVQLLASVDSVLIDCDPIAAQQAVGNIVQNAIAYGDNGGKVAVSVDVLAEGRFALTVADDGPGIPPEEMPRLGQRTFRSDDARGRDPTGSGLGLAITTEVCARAGFELRFARAVPRGLIVTIEGRLAETTADQEEIQRPHPRFRE